MAQGAMLSINASNWEFANASVLVGNTSLMLLNSTNFTEACDCTTGDLTSSGPNCSCVEAVEEEQPFIPWNNPDNVITRDMLLLIERVITCYVNVILVAVGVPTNIVNAIIFYRQGLSDRMNLCLFSLSIVDMFVVLLWFLLGSFCYVGYFLEPFRKTLWKWQVRKYIRGFHRGFYFSSGCLTMIVAVERCVCVVLPFKASTIMRTRTMGILILTAVVTMHVFCSVYLIKFDVGQLVDPATNTTLVVLPPTAVYLDIRSFVDIMENTVIMVTVPSVTFTVVCIATLITVISLRQSIAWRESAASGNAYTKAQAVLVKMLLVVSCIYIATSAPNVMLGITRSLLPDFWLTGRYANIFVATHLLYLALGTLNSTVNFFVYATCSSRFRAHLFDMTSRHRFTKRKDTHTLDQPSLS